MSNFNEFEYDHKNFLKNNHIEVNPLSDEGFKKYISNKSYVYHFLNKPKFVKRETRSSLIKSITSTYNEGLQQNDEKFIEIPVIDQRDEEINIESSDKNKNLNCSREENAHHQMNEVSDPKLLITRIPRKKSSLHNADNLKNSVLQVAGKKMTISRSLINIKNDKLLVNRKLKSNQESNIENLGYEELGHKIKDLNRSIFSHPANSSILQDNLRIPDEGHEHSKLIDPYYLKKSGRRLKMSSKPSFNNSDIDNVYNRISNYVVMMEKRNIRSSKSPIRNSPSRSPVPHPIHQITKKFLDPEAREKLSKENQKLKNILLEQTDSKFLGSVHLPQISHLPDHPVLSKYKLELTRFFGKKYNPYEFNDKKERIHRNHLGAKFCN
jgi:hypothetical protein